MTNYQGILIFATLIKNGRNLSTLSKTMLNQKVQLPAALMVIAWGVVVQRF